MAAYSLLAWIALLVNFVFTQHIGTYEPEVHPRIPILSCPSAETTCTTLNTSLVMDAEWRWVHKVGTYISCYSDGFWNSTLCPDGATCAENCALDGATYERVYGVTVKETNLTLQWIQFFDYSQNVGSRLFVMAEGSDDKYKMWKLLNKEIAFDVDVSQVPCGLSGNLYLVGMEEDGGTAKYKSNEAGARFGTGYCDSSCPKNLRFISGEANVRDWKPNPINTFYSGSGKYGSCCPEVDIWQANAVSNALTVHPCSANGQVRCSDNACTSTCDADGCDFNSYRLGNMSFYGPGKMIDTAKKFTVITQFLTHDNTDTGTLVAIRRLYVQDGVLYSDAIGNVPSIPSSSGLTDTFCRQQKAVFADKDIFTEKGGMLSVSRALERGMVLAFAITEDQEEHMLWLDSKWPLDADPNMPGAVRGSCMSDSGHPQDLLYGAGRARVSFANVRVGSIGMVEATL